MKYLWVVLMLCGGVSAAEFMTGGEIKNRLETMSKNPEAVQTVPRLSGDAMEYSYTCTDCKQKKIHRFEQESGSLNEKITKIQNKGINARIGDMRCPQCQQDAWLKQNADALKPGAVLTVGKDTRLEGSGDRRLKNGDQVTLLDVKDYEAYVQPHGMKFYVPSNVIKDGVLQKDARVRLGRSTAHPTLGIVSAGSQVKVRTSAGDWSEIEYPKELGLRVEASSLVKPDGTRISLRPHEPPQWHIKVDGEERVVNYKSWSPDYLSAFANGKLIQGNEGFKHHQLTTLREMLVK